MSKYINIDELLNGLPDDLPYKASVKRVLLQAPTADVVEVVRCKDCERRHTTDCYLWYGSTGDIDYILATRDDFYCSYGKRIENDET